MQTHFNFINRLPILIYFVHTIVRELTSKGKEQANKDLRSELGYKLTIQVDQHDPARPLAVLQVP